MSLVPDYVFNQNLHPVTSTCFISRVTGDYLITGDEKGAIKLWDLVTYKRSLLIEVHRGKVNSIQSSGGLIVTQSRGDIKVWKFIESPIALELIRTYQASMVSLSTCCLMSLDCGDYLLACCPSSDPEMVELHHSGMDSTSSVKSFTRIGLLMVVKLVCYTSRNGVTLLSGYESGVLKCHRFTLDENDKISAQRECSSFSIISDMITSIDFDDSSLKGVCGSVDSKLVTFTIHQSGDGDSFELSILKSIDIGNQGISSVVIRPDHRLLGVSCWDFRIKLFSWKTMKLLAVLDKHKQSINSISFSDKLLNCKKMFLAIASNDRTVSLWSPYNDV